MPRITSYTVEINTDPFSFFKEPGGVRIRKKTVSCDLLSTNASGITGVIASSFADMNDARHDKSASILLPDGEQIGTISRIAFHPSTGLLIAVGTLFAEDSANEILQGDFGQEQVFAKPDLRVDTIICAVCEREYKSSDSSLCECIAISPTILIKKIFVNSVTLLPIWHEKITKGPDLRSEILAGFFSSSSGLLSWDSPKCACKDVDTCKDTCLNASKSDSAQTNGIGYVGTGPPVRTSAISFVEDE